MNAELPQNPLPGFGVEPLPTDRPMKVGQSAVSYAPTKQILTKATGFMDAYDFTLNPYSGCSFGCTYCYAAFFSGSARSRHTWGEWVKVKENAVELMDRHRPGYLDGKLIYMSSVTDPYQPIERKLGITQRILEIMAEEGRHKPKLVIQTRSPDVVRDTGLFKQIERNGGRVRVNMTVTTDDEDIRRTFEPSCPSNAVRLSAIGQVNDAGIDTCITMTPLVWVNDPYAFADSLLATGVENFISQPFHFKRGKFLAGTRDRAFTLMAEKLGCTLEAFRKDQSIYMTRYKEALDVFKSRLPNLGEGKDGFSPPF